MRVDAGRDGTVNAMEADVSSNAIFDGNVIIVGTTANVDPIRVIVGKDGIVNAMEVDASSNATIDGNVNDARIDAIIDVANDFEVVDTYAIFGDTKDMGEEALTKREARRVDTKINGVANAMEVDAISYAIVDGDVIDSGIDAIIDAANDVEVVSTIAIFGDTKDMGGSSSNAIVDGNVIDVGTNAVIDATYDIEVVSTNAILGGTKDMSKEVLTDKGDGVGEAIIKTNGMAQDKAVCQTNVPSLEIDAQAIHDGVHTDVEHDKLEKDTLSTSTTISSSTYAIVDPRCDVGTHAIFGDTKDVGVEALIDRGARIGKVVLKIDVVAQDNAIWQTDVVGLAVDVQVGHDDVIVDYMVVDTTKTNGIANAMKVNARTNIVVDNNVNDIGTNVIIDADYPIVDAVEVVGIAAAVRNTRGLSNPLHDVGSVHDTKGKGKAATENPSTAMPATTDIV
ncbi:hypothetical protein L7F22_006674 [Adiantum nelumboides]|nr:hypothetical protein [Adiantum nelumboides]